MLTLAADPESGSTGAIVGAAPGGTLGLGVAGAVPAAAPGASAVGKPRNGQTWLDLGTLSLETMSTVSSSTTVKTTSIWAKFSS